VYPYPPAFPGRLENVAKSLWRLTVRRSQLSSSQHRPDTGRLFGYTLARAQPCGFATWRRSQHPATQSKSCRCRGTHNMSLDLRHVVTSKASQAVPRGTTTAGLFVRL